MEQGTYSSPFGLGSPVAGPDRFTQVRLDEIRKMLISAQFRVLIHDDATDEPVYPPLITSFVPHPGTIILHEGEAWKVDRVQVSPPHPDSRAAKEGAPTLVDVMAVKSTGVHHMTEGAPGE